MRKLWRRFKTLLLAAFVAGAATAIWPADTAPFILFQPLHRLEWIGYDALFEARGIQPEKLDPRIVVLGYDRNSEKLLGESWPVGRNTIAQVIRNLKRAGARLIVVDVLFSFPTTKEHDLALDAALKEPGATVLACRLDRDTVQRQISLEAPYYDDALGIDFEANARIGFVEVSPGVDHVVRTIVPAMRFMDDWYPSLAAAAYLELTAPGESPVRTKNSVSLGKLEVPPTGPKQYDAMYGGYIPSAYVNFRGGFGAFASPATFEQVYRNDAAIRYFEGKIVFLGVSGLDMAKQQNDLYSTAFSRFTSETVGGAQLSGEMPGLIVQAHLLNSLLTRSFVTPAPAGLRFAATLVFALVGIGLSRKYLNWRGPFFLALAIAAYLATSILLFSSQQTHLPYAIPSIFILLTAGMVTMVERAGIKKKWAGYVSPDVLEQIFRTEEGESVAQRYRASIVFGDIRGFTKFSDEHDAELVIQLLNIHFERLTDIIYAERGTIDKFLGDGILVVFGAPVRSRNSALRAVRASLKMQEASREPIELDGKTYTFDTGFGITTGEFVAGHVGSRKRHDFSVIGDVVNVASRLQGVTGEPDVIIDLATYETLREFIEVEPLGRVALKGKPEPVPCFKVLSMKSHDESGQSPPKNRGPLKKGPRNST